MLALHGRRAIRARALNVAWVAVSVFMNVIAAAPGWRALAIWVMPLMVYALASDSLIIRAWRSQGRRRWTRLADEQVTPLAVLAGLALWLLRPDPRAGSTLAGFRRWVIEERPAAPGTGSPPPGRSRQSPRLGPLRAMPGGVPGTAPRLPGLFGGARNW